MKYLAKAIFLLLLVMVTAFSCNDIEGMSDDNSIRSFVVTSYSPEEFVLGQVTIEGENIYVPIEYGKYIFPLTIRATATFDKTIDQVIGVDFDQDIVLESIDTKLRFRVMAESGMTTTYYICPQEVPLEESNALYTAFETQALSQDIPLYSSMIQASDSSMHFFAIEGQYPISITPLLETSPLASFVDFDNGSDELVFESVEDTCSVSIMAQSGLIKEWYLRFFNLEVANGQATSSTSREVSDFNARTVSASIVSDQGQHPASVDEIYVDNLDDKITIGLVRPSSGEIEFPLSINISSEHEYDARYIGFTDNTTMVFESIDDTKSFYTIDTKNYAAREFTISLETVLSSKAEITAIDYTYSCFSYFWFTKWIYCATLDNSATQIFSDNGEIYLAMTDYNSVDTYVVGLLVKENWYVSITPTITVSEGATYVIDSDTYWGTGDESYTGVKTVTVTAEDGTVKTWSIYIKDTRSYVPVSYCELLSLTIDSYSPNYVVFDPTTPVSIDETTKTVTLHLFDDQSGYPLSVTPSVTVSPMASSDASTMVFDDEYSTNTITVTAEDGTTSTWTVQLEAPERETSANIAGMSITSKSSSSIVVDKTEVDTDQGEVLIYLSDVEASMFPITLGYEMTLSLKASSSMDLRGSMSFESYKDIKYVTVTSESGEQREWQISILSKPQFANSDLNSWTDTQTAVYWTSANNGTVKGTSRTTGSSGAVGDYAAMMTTESAIGKIAAGSLFNGWFDIDNVISGMNDPTSLTFFGTEFAASAKIIGLSVDIAYHAGGGAGSDTGSAIIDLVYFDKSSGKEFIYHGADSNGDYHDDNTAVSVASKKIVFGNLAETGVEYVPDDEWVRITLDLDYDDNIEFTHLSIVFSSGSKGDQFIGENGSTLKVDNIEILYED